MDTTLDFTRWTEKPLGVAYRRWVITSTGLRQVFRSRFFRLLLLLAWASGLVLAVLGFFFGQSIAPGGWLESLGAMGGPRGEAIVSAFCSYVLLYPDVVIQGFYVAVFWGQTDVGLGLSLVALTVVIPGLITRDRAGNALTMYLSRPLTSVDYMIGKFGVIVGILLAVWTGPLLLGWLLCLLFAPDMSFVTYSFLPLGQALAFNLVSLLLLATLALGISAVTKSSAYAILLWLGAWILVGIVGKIPFVPEWIRSLSFTHDLDVIRYEIFRPDVLINRAVEMIPLLPAEAVDATREVTTLLHPASVTTTLGGLLVLMALSVAACFRKLRPGE